MLDFNYKSIKYDIDFDFSKYVINPEIHNQTIVRTINNELFYDPQIVNKVKDLNPIITEYHNVTLNNKKNKQSETFSKNQKIKPVFLTGYTNSYHHFLIDIIGKILYLKSNKVGDFDIKIIYNSLIKEDSSAVSTRQFQKDIFNILELPEFNSCLVNIHDHVSLFFDKVLVAESTNGNMDNFYITLKLIRDRFVREYSFKNKIFVSRKNAASKDDNGRRLVDEEIIQNYYESKGYKIAFFEEMSFIEQVELASSCSEIVTYNGSSMVNTLFAPEGCKIVEIRNSLKQQHDAYYFWSQWFNKDHRIVECFGATTSQEVINAIENLV